jgi:hypothetical protein
MSDGLQDETARDSLVRELDAEVRALEARLHRTREELAGRRSWIHRGMASLTSWFRGLRRSRLGRAAAVLRSVPSIVVMTIGSGDWHGSARAVKRFVAHPRRIREASLLARSGVFDGAYYLTHNPDVVNWRIHPLIHYVLWGAFEGRRPNALFDPVYYLESRHDVNGARIEPFSHFLIHGAREETNPGPEFDTRYYLAANPDVRAAGINPLVHFVKGGWREGRNPSPTFDPLAYVARYEDVRSSGVNPLAHYIEIGLAEGRNAEPLADAALAPLKPRRLTTQSLAALPPDRPLLVCLTHVCPWPVHAGNAYRINRLLQRLQDDGFRIVPVVVPLVGDEPSGESIRKVVEQFSNVVVVGRDGRIRYSLTDVPDVLASLDGDYTPRYSALLGEDDPKTARNRELLVLDRTYCHDAAIATALRLHSALNRYVLLTEYVWMSRLLPLVDERAIKVIDTIDVYSTKKEKVLRFGVRDVWLDPDEEARRLKPADLVIAIQNDERTILQRLVPDTPVVTAGVDFDISGDARIPVERRILYVASANPMNIRGLRDFFRFAWPSIQQAVPGAELLVAGGVSETIVSDLPGVRRLGNVTNERLDELYRSARVVINPAHAGTGVKIKTIEALSRLRPIVTWPTGVDGLSRELRSLCDVVEDWYEFGPRVVARLVIDREEAFSEAERRVIERETSPDTVYGELSARLLSLWQRRAASPAVAGRAGSR